MRSGRGLRPYGSVDENQFLRGVGEEEQWSNEKQFDGGEQRGMITGYAAAVL